MTESMYRQLTGTPRRPEILQAVWASLCDRQAGAPEDHRLIGARIAAQWTLGLSPVAPISRQETVADDLKTAMESHAAAMVVDGVTGTNVDYARGVEAWLFWWRGLEDLPSWLRPQGEGR